MIPIHRRNQLTPKESGTIGTTNPMPMQTRSRSQKARAKVKEAKVREKAKEKETRQEENIGKTGRTRIAPFARGKGI